MCVCVCVWHSEVRGERAKTRPRAAVAAAAAAAANKASRTAMLRCAPSATVRERPAHRPPRRPRAKQTVPRFERHCAKGRRRSAGLSLIELLLCQILTRCLRLSSGVDVALGSPVARRRVAPPPPPLPRTKHTDRHTHEKVISFNTLLAARCPTPAVCVCVCVSLSPYSLFVSHFPVSWTHTKSLLQTIRLQY